jgi:SAM-dependent methyltransferase
VQDLAGMDLRLKAVLSGMSTYIPGADLAGFTGGTDSARYCYAVWMRHLMRAAGHGRWTACPRVVAELGPGDSIGIGLAALLSGAAKYFALDLVSYSAAPKNLRIFDELVDLFAQRARIPDEQEFPHLLPRLGVYEFPGWLASPGQLEAALAPARLAAIRRGIEDADAADSMIRYKAPWTAGEVIDEGGVDYIFSQAVLEHIDDLEGVYAAMRRWLKPGGLMTHQIDFKCHDKAGTWNGHWAYPEFVWKIIVGRRPYLLNRQPHSAHVALLGRHGFDILEDAAEHLPSRLRREQLNPRLRGLTDADLTTSGAFIVAARAV